MKLNITNKKIGITFKMLQAAQEKGGFQNAFIKGNPKKYLLHWTKG